MIFYITAPDGKLVEPRDRQDAPPNEWVFRLEYLPDAKPKPVINVYRTKERYNMCRGQTVLDKFKGNGGIIPGLNESVREIVIRELEELVAVGSKTRIIYPSYNKRS